MRNMKDASKAMAAAPHVIEGKTVSNVLSSTHCMSYVHTVSLHNYTCINMFGGCRTHCVVSLVCFDYKPTLEQTFEN